MKNLEIPSLEGLPICCLSVTPEGIIKWMSLHTEEVLGYNPSHMGGSSLFDLAPVSEKNKITNLLSYRSANTGDGLVMDLFDVRGFLRPFFVRAVRSEKGDLFIALNEQITREKVNDPSAFIQELLFEEVPFGLLCTDGHGRVLHANKEARMKGMDQGGDIFEIFREGPRLMQCFSDLLNKDKAFEDELTIESGKALKCSFKPYFKDNKVMGALIGFSDAVHLKKMRDHERMLESLLQESMGVLESLVYSSRRINSSLIKKEILQETSRTIKEIFRPDAHLIISIDKDRRVLEYSSGAGSLLHKIKELPNELSDIREPSLYPDTSQLKDGFTLLVEGAFASALLLPVMISEHRKLVFALLYHESRPFKKGDVEVLDSLGKTTAAALENARMYNEIKNFAASLEKRVCERTLELQESNRMKDLFVDIMAHDLLKPVEVARLSSELALEKERDGENKKFILNVFQSLKRVVELIQNATMFAKLEAGSSLDMEDADLTKMLAEAVEQMREGANQRNMTIDLRTKSQAEAMINPLMYDVFVNLIGNAVKYGREGTVIETGIEKKGNFYRVYVSNRGEGIPGEHKEDIFTRFKRIEKGSVQGTGLGLAIVKKVAEAHNGRVWVEDNPRGGSVFNVRLPIKPQRKREEKK